MKIITTTLAGSDTEEAIVGALESVVDQVDECLVICTGISRGEAVIRAARGVVGDKLRVNYWVWEDDFSRARNHALDEAARQGADWAMTLDTDERMLFEDGFNLRERLEQAQQELILVEQADRTYWKERLFKLPSTLRWRGPTHEILEGAPTGQKMVGVRFSELAKTPEQLQRKFTRDRDALQRWVRRHPTEARWWYNLGCSHHGLGEIDEAIRAYMQCATYSVWPEEGSWACFAAATCHLQKEQYGQAIKACATGLMIRPACAELAWIAGVASWHMKRLEDALAWSNMAIANGGERFPRMNFCDRQGLYHGPWQILYKVHTELGNKAEAAEAEAQWWKAKEASGT